MLCRKREDFYTKYLFCNPSKPLTGEAACGFCLVNFINPAQNERNGLKCRPFSEPRQRATSNANENARNGLYVEPFGPGHFTPGLKCSKAKMPSPAARELFLVFRQPAKRFSTSVMHSLNRCPISGPISKNPDAPTRKKNKCHSTNDPTKVRSLP